MGATVKRLCQKIMQLSPADRKRLADMLRERAKGSQVSEEGDDASEETTGEIPEVPEAYAERGTPRITIIVND